MAASGAVSLQLRPDTPPAPERRPRLLLVGTAFASAGVAAAFLAMVSAYVAIRADVVEGGTAWLPEGGVIPLPPGNMSMVSLAMSVVTVQWAVYAGRNHDRPHAYGALALTMLFGVSHLTEMGYLFTQWNIALNGAATTPGTLLFSVIGAHMAITIGGLVFLLLMFIRSLGGQFTGRDAEGLSAAALFWWVTVGLYAVIWYAVLITK